MNILSQYTRVYTVIRSKVLTVGNVFTTALTFYIRYHLTSTYRQTEGRKDRPTYARIIKNSPSNKQKINNNVEIVEISKSSHLFGTETECICFNKS